MPAGIRSLRSTCQGFPALPDPTGEGTYSPHDTAERRIPRKPAPWALFHFSAVHAGRDRPAESTAGGSPWYHQCQHLAHEKWSLDVHLFLLIRPMNCCVLEFV